MFSGHEDSGESKKPDLGSLARRTLRTHSNYSHTRQNIIFITLNNVFLKLVYMAMTIFRPKIWFPGFSRPLMTSRDQKTPVKSPQAIFCIDLCFVRQCERMLRDCGRVAEIVVPSLQVTIW